MLSCCWKEMVQVTLLPDELAGTPAASLDAVLSDTVPGGT